MNPSVGDYFWSHMPAWIWPIVVIGIAGFFLYKAVEASEVLSRIFGKIGIRIHGRASRVRRVLAHAERLEEILESVNDRLECNTAYLVLDADYHREADMIIAEKYPSLAKLLPIRTPYSTFAKKWREGWRPPSYEDGWCK